MDFRRAHRLAGFALALLAGCGEQIEGPPLTLTPTVGPATACNADNEENQALQTRVVFRAAAGSAFAPLPTGVLTADASLALPRVALRGPDGEVVVRQVEFVSTQEMALWVTRTTRGTAALTPGSYTLAVTNPDGSLAQSAMGALRIVPPPTLTAVTRVAPTVPPMGVEDDEAQTICNNADSTLSLAGSNFRPDDPTPVVEVLNAAGMVVRRVPEPEVRVVSATEIRINLRAPADPANRLPPGRYGLRVTNPDGASSTVVGLDDAGVDSDAGDAGAGGLTGYPQGCRVTRPSLFNVVPPPEVRAVEPVSSCSSRMQQFVVRGAHFRRGVTVTVDAMPPYVVPADAIMYARSTGTSGAFDTLTLSVPAGALPPGGAYAVSVRNADACSVTFAPQCPAGTAPTDAPNTCAGTVNGRMGTGPRSLTVYADPTVTAVQPRGACNATSVPVTITGTNFHSTYGVEPDVRINDTPLVNVRVTSTTTLEAEVPMTLMAGSPLGTPYDVRVTVPEGCGGTLARGFTLFPPPTLTAVAPGSVCVDQPRTTLTLTGTNFHEFEGAAPTVTVGSVPPTRLRNVRVVSATELSGELPPETPPGGPYDVTVTTPVSCSVTLPRAFTFHAAPTVTAAMAQASCTGGDPVLVITGTNFHATGMTQPTVVLETGTPVTLQGVRVTSDTTLVATLPTSLPGGMYAARVTMPEGCSARSPTFTYNPGALVTPTLAGMIPSRGWNGIDMPVTIVGTGLATLTSLSLRGAAAGGGDLALTDISVASSDVLSATIPAGGRAGGPYDLVSTVSGCPITLARAYTITDTPAITLTRVTPPFGWTGGTTPIAIQGAGFASTPRVYLVIPSRTPRMVPLRRPVFVSESNVTALVPSGLPPGMYDLAAINPDGGGGLLRSAFRVTMQPPPTLTDVTPGAGTTQSPTTVTLSGTEFRSPQVTLLNAAGQSVMGTVTASSAMRITATLPTPMLTPGAYIVRVTNPDEGTYAEFGSFVVTNPAVKLGPFSSASSLTTARRGAAVVSSQVNAVTRFLYAIGGDGGASGPTHASVEFASVDLLGRLGSWRVQRYPLPAPVTGIANAAVERNGYIYVLGGAGADGMPRSAVLRAKVLDFSTAPVIGDPEVSRVSTGGLAQGAWIYRVAAVMPSTDADNPGGETLPSDEVTAFFVFRSTVRLRWGAIPGASAYRVYRTPTVNGASSAEVLLATVMGTETTFVDDGTATPSAPSIDTRPLAVGSTGVWTATGMGLDTARATTAAALAADPTGALFVYALTGRGTAGPLDSYAYAPLSANGAQLGPFMAGSARFADAREYAAAAVASGRSAPVVTAGSFVYVTGGFGTGGGLRTTEFARVDNGGALASLTGTSSYAMRRGALAAYIVNNEFYAMGGINGANPASAALNSTNLATLMASGVPGNFSNASVSMANPRANFGLALASAYFFAVGGSSSGTNALSSVEQTIY